MKKLIPLLALSSAIWGASAIAANVGVSISLGEPGFYGQLDIDNGYRPRLISSTPVIVQRRYRNLAPIYLRVPAAQTRNWSRYCDRYNACTRPVYFVRDDWYQREYAPRYRQQHSGNWHNDRPDGRDDNRRDDRGNDHNDHNDHNDRDRDHDRGNGH